MPFIDIKTTAEINKEKENELISLLGKAIENIPGKTEKWLMLNFSDNQRMSFASDNKSGCAILEVKIFGKATKEAYDALTSALCEIAGRVLSLDPARIYIKYEEIDTWGWNGFNF